MYRFFDYLQYNLFYNFYDVTIIYVIKVFCKELLHFAAKKCIMSKNQIIEIKKALHKKSKKSWQLKTFNHLISY